MAEVKWIKITTDIFDDEKIKLIEAMPEKDTILVIWFKLLTLAGKVNDGGNIHIANIPTTDEMLATLFNRPLNSIRLALTTFQNFGMISLKKNYQIVNWDKHQNLDGLEKIKKQNAERAKRHRDKLKEEKLLIEEKSIKSIENSSNVMRNVTDNVTVTQSNALDIDIEKELDKESYDHDHIYPSNNNINIEQKECQEKNENEDDFFENDIEKIKKWFDENEINFSKKHQAKIIELLKNNSADFLLKTFVRQLEIIKANPSVKNSAAVFSNHLFKGTCEVDKLALENKEKEIENSKNNEGIIDENFNEILNIFLNLSDEKQKEIETKILNDKNKIFLLEIKKSNEIMYYRMIFSELKKLLKSENLILR